MRLCLSLLSATLVFNANRFSWITGYAKAFVLHLGGGGEGGGNRIPGLSSLSHQESEADCSSPSTPLPICLPYALQSPAGLLQLSPGRLHCLWVPMQVDQALSLPFRKKSLLLACHPRLEGPALTFFPRHLRRKESPEEKEPQGELDPAS